VVKQTVGSWDEKICKAIEGYNESLHTAIKCVPMEAWRDQTQKFIIENDECRKFKRFIFVMK
jgi:hypothetical protein